MASQNANEARLKSAVEFGRTEMSEGSELHRVRASRRALRADGTVKNIDGGEVLAHLMLNMPDYYGDMTQRELAVELGRLPRQTARTLRPEEASAARVLRELVKNQRLG